MAKKPKSKKEEPIQENEAIIDYNPDDMEAGEELPGVKKVKGKLKNIEKSRDINPDDFEE